MLGKFFRTLFPSHPATYRSDFPIDEAVRRLAEVVNKGPLSRFDKNSASGFVTRDLVRIKRGGTFANPYKPVFVGYFKSNGEETELSGEYTISVLAKMFSCLWISFVIFGFFVGIKLSIESIFYDGFLSISFLSKIVFSFIPFALLMFLYAFIHGSWRLSESDMSVLSKIILRTLTKSGRQKRGNRPAKPSATGE